MVICFILAAISIIYGIAVLRVASGTMFFFVWFMIGACLILLGVGIRAHVFSMIPRAVKGILLALLAAGMVTFCIACALIGTHFHDRGNKNLDYLIVLGAQVKVKSQDEVNDAADRKGTVAPSVVLEYRLETAAEYLHQNPNTICVVSGGKSALEPEPEGDVMARWLTEHGVSQDRILIENRSKNTVENIRNSLALISDYRKSDTRVSIGIVTNNFHVYRGTAIARKSSTGTSVTEVCGIAAPSNPFYLPNNILRESMGIVKDFLKRNI